MRADGNPLLPHDQCVATEAPAPQWQGMGRKAPSGQRQLWVGSGLSRIDEKASLNAGTVLKDALASELPAVSGLIVFSNPSGSKSHEEDHHRRPCGVSPHRRGGTGLLVVSAWNLDEPTACCSGSSGSSGNPSSPRFLKDTPLLDGACAGHLANSPLDRKRQLL